MVVKKSISISYDARDFESIKQALINHAKRYYSDNFKDFSEAGFGSLMLDLVAYVGDNLSFMLDYEANESFLSTALEFNNIAKLARQIGYKFDKSPTSTGIATFFILIPANANGFGPDKRYIPVLKAGSTFSTTNGNQFILNDDVRFDQNNNEIVVARVDQVSGLPTTYAIKSYGRVISGAFQEVLIDVGDFKRYLKLEINIPNMAEIISVEDDQGNEYFEVDNLSQDVIYKPISNRTGNDTDVNSFLRPFSVPRRFVVETDGIKTFLQFGQGQEILDINKEKIADPTTTIIKYFGKNYISDKSFDPTNLIDSDKFGIVPVNTTLSIKIRTNVADNVNASADTLTSILGANFDFVDSSNLDSNLVRDVKASLETTNEESIIGDVSSFSANELRLRALNSYSAQNRAVSREDYKILIYKMPSKYGSIKRANVIRDETSFKRNLNVFVISEDTNGKLIQSNSTLKSNLKVWLNNNKMLNDVIEIKDARIINLGIDFIILSEIGSTKHDILNQVLFNLKNHFKRTGEIGEPFFIRRNKRYN